MLKDSGFDKKLQDRSWRALICNSILQLKDDQATGNTLYILMSIFRGLNILNLPLSSDFGGAWYSGLSTLRAGLRHFSFGFYSFTDSQLIIALLIIVCEILLVCASSALLVLRPGYFGTKSRRTLEVILRLNQFPLQQGILMILARCAVGSSEITGLEVLTKTVASVAIILHLFLTSSAALLLYQNLPAASEASPHGISMVHGRVECVSTLVCGIFDIFAGVILERRIRYTDQSTIAITSLFRSLCIVGTGFVAGLYFFFAPFYSMPLNRFNVNLYTFLCWASVCSVAAVAVYDADDLSSMFLWILTTPFLLKSVQFAQQLFFAKLLAITGISQLNNPMFLELKLRLQYLQGDHREWSFSGDLEKDYRLAVAEMPDSAFLIFLTALLAASKGNSIVYSLKLIRQARRVIRYYDEILMLAYNNKINERRQEMHTGAITFLQHDQHLTAAQASIVQITKHITQFWKKTSQGQSSIQELLALANRVHEEVQDCQSHLAELQRLAHNDVQGLRVQAMFLQYIEHDSQRAQELLARASSFNSDNGMEGFAVCVLSGDLSSIGKILEVSHPLCSLFGYSKVDLLGRNIIMIIPPPFDRIHDRMLRNFVASDSDFSTQTRRIYGLHRKGYIIPVDFVLTPSTNANSDLVLVARLTPKRLACNEHILLVDRASGTVTACTEDTAEELGIDEHDIYALAVPISSVLPNFYNDIGELTYRGDGGLVEIAQMLFRVRVHELEYKSRITEGDDRYECSVIMVNLKRDETAGFGMQYGFSHSPLSPGMSSKRGESSSSGFNFGLGAGAKSKRIGGSRLSGLGRSSQQQVGSRQSLSSTVSHSKTSPKSPSKSPRSPKSPVPFQMHGTSFGSRFSRASNSKSFAHGSDHRPSDTSDRGNGNEDGAVPDSQMEMIKCLIAVKLSRRDAQVVRFQKFAAAFGIAAFLVMTAKTVFFLQKYNIQVDLINNIRTAASVMHLCTLASALVQYDAQTFGSEMRTELITTLSEIETNYRILIDGAIEGSQEFETLVYSPDVEEWPYQGTALDAVSFDVAIHSFMSHMGRVIDAGVNETGCDSSCQYLINNGPFSILKQGRIIIEKLQTTSIGHMYTIQLMENSIAIAITGVLLISIISGYVPILTTFHARRVSVTSAFRAIPPSLRLSLHKESDSRFQTLQQLQHQHEISAQFNGSNGQKSGLSDDDDGDDDNDGGDNKSFDGGKRTGGGLVLQNTSLIRTKANGSGAGQSNSSDDSIGASIDESMIGGPEKIKRQQSTKVHAAREQVAASFIAKDQMLKRRRTFRGSLRRITSLRHARLVSAQVSTLAADQKLKWSRSVSRWIRRLGSIVGAVFYVGISAWVTLAFILAEIPGTRNFRSQVGNLGSSIYVAATRTINRDEVNFLGMIPLPGSSSVWQGAETRYEDSFLQLQSATIGLAMSSRELKYGNSSIMLEPYTSTNGTQFTLNFESACLSRCLTEKEAIDSGLRLSPEPKLMRNLRRGLLFALDQYIRDGYLLGQIRLGHHTSNLSTSETLQESLFGDLPANLMLSEALIESTDAYYESLLSAVQDRRFTESKTLIILIALLLVGHIICSRAVYALERELNKIYYLLSILPEQVYTQVPQFLALLRDEHNLHDASFIRNH